MSTEERQPLLYEFDRFTVDPRQRLLFASGARTPVDLPPRAFDALLYLVERHGELLTKRELLRALWPTVVVEENSLNQVISLVRKVLGEKPSEHRFIVTAPGRGYRFVAAVRTRREGDDALHAPDPLCVAILPFSDDGREPLGGAIAADMARLLSARSRLRVAAVPSGGAESDSSPDICAIARTLGVARVVDGRVGHDGEHVSVTARLLDGATGRQIRSVHGRRLARDLMELQVDLARDMGQTLDPDAPATLDGNATADAEAYLHYLRALSLSMKPSAESILKAITLLRAALERDPCFWRAKSLLAIQYTSCVMFGLPLPGALDLARHEAAGALLGDDQNGETYCAAAVTDCLGGAWSRAEERFRIAHSLTANPLVDGLRCAYLSLSVGHYERGFQQAEHALKIAPTHPIGVHLLATLHLARGEYEQAAGYANLALELGQSRSVAPLSDIFPELALQAGRRTEAVRELTALFPERLRTSALPSALQQLCEPTRSQAQQREAAGALRVVETSLTDEELDPPMRKRLMAWYCRAGALDDAFDLAARSLDLYTREGTVGGAWGVLWLPVMRPFRADTRFEAFARRLRLFEYWSEYGPPDGYSLAGDRLQQVS
jgi:DNA-binding winged helix-turn-helix (wHTH) protein/tetratricopeptide (TPR) repeat protein